MEQTNSVMTKTRPAAATVVMPAAFARIVNFLSIVDKYACIASFNIDDDVDPQLSAFEAATYGSIIDNLFGSAIRKRILLLNYRDLLESHHSWCIEKVDEAKTSAAVAQYEEFLLDLLERQLPRLHNLSALYLNIVSSNVVPSLKMLFHIQGYEVNEIHYRNTSKTIELLTKICSFNKNTITTCGILGWLPVQVEDASHCNDEHPTSGMIQLRSALSNRYLVHMLGSQLTNLETVCLPDPADLAKMCLLTFGWTALEQQRTVFLGIWQMNRPKLGSIFQNVKSVLFFSLAGSSSSYDKLMARPMQNQYPLFPNAQRVYIAEASFSAYSIKSNTLLGPYRHVVFPATPTQCSISLNILTLTYHIYALTRHEETFDWKSLFQKLQSRATDTISEVSVKSVIVDAWAGVDDKSESFGERWYDKNDAQVNAVRNGVWQALSSATAPGNCIKAITSVKHAAYNTLRFIPASLFWPYKMGMNNSYTVKFFLLMRGRLDDIMDYFKMPNNNGNSLLRHWSSVCSNQKLSKIAHMGQCASHKAGESIDGSADDDDDAFALAYCLDRQKSQLCKWLEFKY